jgi:hypothetical protein
MLKGNNDWQDWTNRTREADLSALADLNLLQGHAAFSKLSFQKTQVSKT